MVLRSTWLAIALEVSAACAAALLVGAGRTRRALALTAAVGALCAGFLAPPEERIARATVALFGIVAFGRVIDLLTDNRPWPAAHRVWLVLTLVDIRRARRCAPSIDRRLLGAVLGYGALAALGCWGAVGVAERFDGAARLGLRWAGGALFTYAVLDTGASLMTAVYRALGVELPALHRAPILSRSLQEFWGERWNRVVSDWLGQHCFRPLARRRRPALGLCAAFLASAALHFWLVLVPLDARMAAMMGAYFLVQAGLLALERGLGIRRLRPGLRRAWAALAVLGPSPLFVEPAVRILGG